MPVHYSGTVAKCHFETVPHWEIIMFGMGSGEFLLVFLVMLVVLGPKNIPEIARSLGKTIKDFRNIVKEIKSSVESGIRLDEKTEDTPDQAKRS